LKNKYIPAGHVLALLLALLLQKYDLLPSAVSF
jgi:hypothetical protein